MSRTLGGARSWSARSAVALTVARLRSLRDQEGRLPRALVIQEAEALGVGVSTLLRYVSRGATPVTSQRPRYVPSARALEAYWEYRGSAAAAHRALVRAGEPELPTLRSFQRAIARELTLAEKTDARAGRRESRKIQLFLERSESKPNTCWEVDFYEVPVPVRCRGREHPRFLWLVVYLDTASRAVMGWAVGEPDQGLVLAAFGDAVRASAERSIYGLPDMIRPDNGKALLARGATQAARVFGIAISPTAPFSPHHKGKIERFFRTIDQECLRSLPLHRDSPRGANGRPYLRRGDNAVSDRLLIETLASFFDFYNWERPHTALEDVPPGRFWQANAVDVREADDADLRRFLSVGANRIVTTKGVRLDNLHYVAPELNALIGTRVEARNYPHDYRSIEIYVREEWVCTAYPSDSASPDLRAEILAARRADHKRATAMRRATNRKQRARIAPRNEPKPAEIITEVPRPDTVGAETLSPQALPALLGLNDRLNTHYRPGEAP